MLCHIRKASFPIGDIEIRVSEPRVSVRGGAAPDRFGDVVVQMDVNLLL